MRGVTTTATWEGAGLPVVVDPAVAAIAPTLRWATLDDVPTLNDIARHPSIWPHIHNDDSAPIDDFTVEGRLALTVRVDDVIQGFYLFDALTPTVWDVHTCLLPELRGAPALVASINTLDMLFTTTPLEVLTTSIPATNRPAAHFATACGFRRMHTIPDGWRQDGTAHPLDRFAIDLISWLRAADGEAHARARHLLHSLAERGLLDKLARWHSTLVAIYGSMIGGV